MSKYIFIPIIAVLFAAVPAMSQNAPQLPNVIPPSPTVANLMNFEEVPVDHYTGQPDISIPLYNKQLNSELSLPVVLRYSSMGVRLEQRSGWTGTGWSLDVGGVVSRTIRGIPDELPSSGFYDNKTGLFHLPDFWDWTNLSAMEQNTFIWNVNGSSTAIYDSEPDLYQFNMPGINGRFLIVYEDGDFVAKQLNLDQKYKIEVVMNDTTKTVTGFTIIDPNGYIYEFGIDPLAIETSISEEHTIVKPIGERTIAAPIETTDLPAANTAWHLTSIKTSNGQTLADFNYVNSQEYYSTPVSRIENVLQNVLAHTNHLKSPYNVGKFRPETVSSTSEITTQTKKLSEIIFSDKTRLKFVPGNEVHPENQGMRLWKIQMLDRDAVTIAREFTLGYSGAAGRLWLTYVNGVGNSYSLDYFQKEQLPGVDGYRDKWGYNNGDFRHDIDKGFNYYDYNAIKRGLLTKITYATGGTKEFTWAPHTFTYEGNTLIDNFDGNPYNATNQNFSHQFTATTNNIGTQSGSQVLVITHDQYIQIQKNVLFGGTYANIMEVRFTSGGSTLNVKFGDLPKMVHIPKGTYMVSVRVQLLETLLDQFTVNGYINIMYSQKKTGDNYNYNLLGGGVRISKIEFKDPLNATPLQTVINYTYNSTAEIDSFNSGEETISSGAIDSRLGSMYKKYGVSDTRYLYADEQQLVMHPTTISYQVTTNAPIHQLTKGNFVGYKKVQVTEGIAFGGTYGNNGSIVYTYTTPQDWPSSQGVFEYPYINNSNLDHKRGLLKSKTVYDKNGEKQEEIINDYDYDARQENIINAFTLTEAACEWTQFYDTYSAYNAASGPTYLAMCGNISCFGGDYQNCSNNNAPFIAHWTYISGMAAELTSSVKTEYFNGTPVQTTTTYDYWDENFQLKYQTETYTEGGSTITYKTEYQYPFPTTYTSSLFSNDVVDPNDNETDNTIAEMAKMVSLNIVNKPVAIVTSRNGAVLQRVINKYDTFAADQLLIKEVETQKGTSAAEDRIIYERYNSIGNVEQVRAANGIYISYMWGYEGTLPIAKVENTLYTSIPNASTIINTSNNGTESALRTQLNAIRTNSVMRNCMVTTLTHNPCKGVLSITDPRGKKQTFEYESNSGWRLKKIKDNEGNLLNEYFYNFR